MLIQLEVEASDGGTPSLSDICTVLIYVNYNLVPPRFLQTGNQTLTLDEDISLREVTSVAATDDDATVSRYILYISLIFKPVHRPLIINF